MKIYSAVLELLNAADGDRGMKKAMTNFYDSSVYGNKQGCGVGTQKLRL
jgi:hypothetical protein